MRLAYLVYGRSGETVVQVIPAQFEVRYNIIQCSPPSGTTSVFHPSTLSRSRQVVLYNRGKTENKQIPGESDADFAKRCEEVKTIVGDRKDPEVMIRISAESKRNIRSNGYLLRERVDEVTGVSNVMCMKPHVRFSPVL